MKAKEIKRLDAVEKEELAKTKKKRVPWEEDGSLEVLMEWITTHGKCAECCGANGDDGKSEAQHCEDLPVLIETKKPEAARLRRMSRMRL